MSANPEWTDDELGYIHETMERPASEVAAHLGRSRESVYAARSRIRSGWSRKKAVLWTPEEDAFVRSNAGRRTVPDLAAELGRTVRATYRRMGALGIRANNGSGVYINPFVISNRPLVAKTCTTCGHLLPAQWFRFVETRGMKGWHSSCKKCLSVKASAREQHGPPRPETSARRKAFTQKADALTIPLAINNRKEYTEADHAVLSDPTLTHLEKALELRRTYTAVSSYASKHGYKSHRYALGDPAHDRWIIANPNAERIDEITALLRQEVEQDAGRPRPEWDWDDDDLKESA